MSLRTDRLTLKFFVITKSSRILSFPDIILYSPSAPALVKTGSQYVRVRKHVQKISLVILLFLTISLIISFALTPYSGFASTEKNNNNILIEPEASQVCQQQMPPPHQYRFSSWFVD
jgi:hypothetical protein